MRTELEKQLAILTFQKEREVVQQITMFGDNNHTIIDYSIKVIKGELNEDDIWDRCEEVDGEEAILTDGEGENIRGICDWLNGDGEELVDLLWNEENLVTELPSEGVKVVSQKHCAKQCKECPFSKNSMQGWLSDYTGQDIINFMNAEASFPCHMQMTDGSLDIEQTKEAIEKGEMKLCRGYVECVIKSAKSPYKNEQLVEAIKLVKEEGLSENTMDIFEFLEHHKK